MYAIAFFGIILALLSAVMVVDPGYWSNGIVRFSQARYFHEFEIISRLGVGAMFIAFSEQSLYPTLNDVIGYLMVAVGVGLLIVGPSRHKQFAAWSAEKFRKAFRPAGIVSFVFGIFITYGALVNP